MGSHAPKFVDVVKFMPRYKYSTEYWRHRRPLIYFRGGGGGGGNYDKNRATGSTNKFMHEKLMIHEKQNL